VVFSVHGKALEHRGIGVSALGDVDDDGVPDFLVGSMIGAYTFYFGPGQVTAYSGRTGARLYSVDGMQLEEGDAFGDTIAPLGDVNDDGTPDFAVTGWRAHNFMGYARVYSGRDGTQLHEVRGGSDFGEGALAAGDSDGDGKGDFIILGGGRTFLFSGSSGNLIMALPGSALASLPSSEAHGLPTILSYDGRFGTAIGGANLTPDTARVYRLPDGESRSEIDVDSNYASRRWIGSAGDLDGDRSADLGILYVPGLTPEVSTSPNAPTHRLRVRSSRTGDVIWESDFVAPSEGSGARIGLGGDIDGDGVGDLVVSWSARGTESNARVEIVSGKNGSVLHRITSSEGGDALPVVCLGDLDGDSHSEILIGDYESPLDGQCTGRAIVISLPTE